MSHKYQAFGFIIETPYTIIQVESASDDSVPDIIVQDAILPELSDLPEYAVRVNEQKICFNYPRAGIFRITNGRLIEFQSNENCNNEILSLYMMGSCMGAIFHQRGLLPIHGSCVTDGTHSVIISGNSGAGKSTLASEFLKNGWKLVTDDVSLIKEINGSPIVQSSYPSQKLWQDSMTAYETDDRKAHSLYERQGREKYGVSVKSSFCNGTVPLTLFVQLYADEEETSITQIKGFDCVDRLVHNTYRDYFISKSRRNSFFQDCVTLSQKIRMLQVIREKGVSTQEYLFNRITAFLNE